MYAGKPSSFYSATGGKPVEGAWYSGQRYMGGQLLAPGQDQPGHQVSNEVIAQTNPANVQYVQAQQIQAPVSPSYTTGANTNYVNGLNNDVANARKAIEESLAAQKAANDAKLQAYQQKEQEALKQVGILTTPFRADLETAERDRLHINENFEANQGLVNELDQLLTQGNNLIKEQQGVTGLAAVRNPRVQQTMSDVAARAGVIQAVMSARNGQIAQAENMIDRTISAMTADRQDQISYYETIINLNRSDMLSLNEDNRKVAEERLGLLKNDLSRAQETADYVKQLMINPDTAQLMADGGVNLNDSIESINQKLAQVTYKREVGDMSNKMSTSGYTAIFDPKGVPANQLVTITDSKGEKHYYRKQVSGGGGFNSDVFLQGLVEQGLKVKNGGATDIKTGTGVNVDSIWNEVLNPGASVGSYGGQPSFSPAGGIGTLWTDAAGTKWKYTQKGWVRV